MKIGQKGRFSVVKQAATGMGRVVKKQVFRWGKWEIRPEIASVGEIIKLFTVSDFLPKKLVTCTGRFLVIFRRPEIGRVPRDGFLGPEITQTGEYFNF